MSSDYPIGWHQNRLAAYISEFIDNTKATFFRRNDWFENLSSIEDIFHELNLNLSEPKNILSTSFIPRCHSAYRGAATMAVASQLSEVYPLLRTCLEYAGYCLLTENSPGELSKLFLERHKDSKNARLISKEFSQANIRSAIEKFDGKLATDYNDLYQTCIDLGAHPNERSITSNSRTVKSIQATTFQHYYFNQGEPMFTGALLYVFRVGIIALKIIGNAQPKKFEILGLNKRIEDLYIQHD